MEQINIVMICQHSSEEFRSQLHLSESSLIAKIRKWVKRPYKDIAPWVMNIVNGINELSDVEFHVVAPYTELRKSIVRFKNRNTTFHVFDQTPGCYAKIKECFFKISIDKKADHNAAIIKSIIDEINPDIILLCGAENPRYSKSILSFNNKPLALLCQTVYSNPKRELSGESPSEYKMALEQRIFNHVHYYFCLGEMHRDLIKRYVADAVFFPYSFPTEPFPTIKEVPKKYDFVFFSARVIPSKGVECAIEALAEVKKIISTISLLIVGDCKPDYKLYLKKRISELGIEGNVTFHGFFDRINDMLQYVKQAKFALLPIKLDIISGTIIQAMHMGLPVITHITSGTPALNKNKQCVLLSEIDDISALSKNMLAVYNDQSLANTLRTNALEYCKKEDVKNASAAGDLIQNCRLILDNYYNNIPIPKERLLRD